MIDLIELHMNALGYDILSVSVDDDGIKHLRMIKTNCSSVLDYDRDDKSLKLYKNINGEYKEINDLSSEEQIEFLDILTNRIDK